MNITMNPTLPPADSGRVYFLRKAEEGSINADIYPNPVSFKSFKEVFRLILA